MIWKTIDSCPKDRTMFVAIGVTAGNGFTGGRPYKTDPYCVWFEDGEFCRWPHNWKPTHWLELPEKPEATS